MMRWAAKRRLEGIAGMLTLGGFACFGLVVLALISDLIYFEGTYNLQILYAVPPCLLAVGLGFILALCCHLVSDEEDD